MEITLNGDTQTIEIRVPADQVPDELLGVLPEATTTAEGCLAWSIRFGDVTRAPKASSRNTVEDELLGIFETLTVADELLGVFETGLGETSLTASTTFSADTASSSEVGPFFIILELNSNFPNTGALTPSIGRPIPIFADNIATSSFDVVSSSRMEPASNTLGMLPNPNEMPVLLFANPFSA